MTISFDRIPQNIRTPGVFTEIDSSRAISGARLIALRYLLIGQMLDTGTAAPDVPVRVTSVQQARTLFGAGSMLANMVAAAIASNNWSEMWCLPLADNVEGVAASASIAVTGTVTSSGTLNLYIGGTRVQVGLQSGNSAANVAQAIAQAVNAAVLAGADIPANSTFSGSTANFEARHVGEAGNHIDLRLNYFGESTPPGIELAITPFEGGAGNPDLETGLAALADEWFQLIALPYSDSASLTALEADLASRFGPLREIEAHAFVAARGTQGTLGALGDSRNSPHLTIVSAQGEPMSPWAKAAETAAIVAYYSSIDPARPLQTLPYAFCLPPAYADRFTRQERNLLLYDGVATTAVDAGGVMRIERMVTTYKTNAAGAPDEAYLDVETLLTLMTIRHDAKARWLTKYPRHKLANDGTRIGEGQAVVTPNVARAELISWFRDWEELGLVEDFDQFKRELVVERDATDTSRLNVLSPVNIINGLRVIATKIQFRL